MKEGYYLMARGWQEHALFEKDDYSRRDAWCYFVESACFKDTVVDVAGSTVKLRRGQFTHSVRFLAKKLKWTRSKVARFLERLKTDTMIETDGGTGQLIITICNYEKYQVASNNAGTLTETAIGTEAGQRRKKENKSPYGASGNLSENDPTKNLFDVGVEYLVSKGTPESQARSFIGKLRKEHDDGAILSAIMQAQTCQAVEPKSWLTAHFAQRNRPTARADIMN